MSTFFVAAITYVDIHTSCMYCFKVASLATLRGGSKICLDKVGIILILFKLVYSNNLELGLDLIDWTFWAINLQF